MCNWFFFYHWTTNFVFQKKLEGLLTVQSQFTEAPSSDEPCDDAIFPLFYFYFKKASPLRLLLRQALSSNLGIFSPPGHNSLVQLKKF